MATDSRITSNALQEAIAAQKGLESLGPSGVVVIPRGTVEVIGAPMVVSAVVCLVLADSSLQLGGDTESTAATEIFSVVAR